jgi:hypothetical protein
VGKEGARCVCIILEGVDNCTMAPRLTSKEEACFIYLLIMDHHKIAVIEDV